MSVKINIGNICFFDTKYRKVSKVFLIISYNIIYFLIIKYYNSDKKIP